MGISQITMDVLISAGWHQGRKINIEPVVKLLESRGFEVYPAVKKFLEEFGMLEIRQQRQNYPLSKNDLHHTWPDRALGELYTKDSFSEYDILAGEGLVLIGMVFDDSLPLFVSESGKLYCDMGKLGDDVWNGWETVLFYGRPQTWDGLRNIKFTSTKIR